MTAAKSKAEREADRKVEREVEREVEIPPEEAYGPFDVDHPPPLDFESWAEISAALLRREPTEQLDILADRELDVELWDGCDLFWLQQLSDQLGRGNTKLAERYGACCAAELKGRDPDRPTAHEEAVRSAAELEPTAFMVALPDDTALPFPSPVAAEPPPLELPAIEATEPAPAQGAGEAHPDVGETQAVPPLAPGDGDLPFKKKEN